MRAPLIAVLVAASLAPIAQGQSATTEGQAVRGAVADSAGLLLPGATVLLSARSDGSLSAFATTDLDGVFPSVPLSTPVPTSSASRSWGSRPSPVGVDMSRMSPSISELWFFARA